MDIESLLTLLTPDTEIILTKAGISIAHVVPIFERPIQRRPRVAGLGGGTTFILSADFDTPLPNQTFGFGKRDFVINGDFDEPLPNEFWLGDEATDPLYRKDQDEPRLP